MGVEEVNVIGLKLFKTVSDAHMKSLSGIALKIDGLSFAEFPRSILCSEFGCQHDKIAVSSFCHPFADPFLRVFILIVGSRINEVTTSVNKGVEESK